MTDSSITDRADMLVGQRIKLARLESGMTGEALATRIGLTPQQLSKLERGLNRVHAGQLWLLAEALERSVDWFFDVPDAASPNVQVTRQARKFFKALHALEPKQIQIVADAARVLADAEPQAARRPSIKRIEFRGSRQRMAP